MEEASKCKITSLPLVVLLTALDNLLKLVETGVDCSFDAVQGKP